MTDTIDFEEVGTLLGLAAARDQRTVGDADILAWHADLNAANITYDDANAALTHYYAVAMPSLQPEHRRRVNAPDLISIVRKAHASRLASFQYEPATDDGEDDGTTYCRRRKAQIADVAAGRRPAELPRQVTAGPPLFEVLAQIGMRVENGSRP